MAATTKADDLARCREWSGAHLNDPHDAEAAQHIALAYSDALAQVPSNPQTILLGLEAYVANVIWNMTADPKEAHRLLSEFGGGVVHHMSMLYGSETPETPFQAAAPAILESLISDGYFGGDRLEDIVAKALLTRTDDQLTISERELYEEKILPVLRAKFEKSKDWRKTYRKLRQDGHRAQSLTASAIH